VRLHIQPSFQQQIGLTLIEIMIALLIGLFIIAGTIQLFVNTKQTYRLQEALSRLQENGRFAMEFIGRDIRMAGYRACPTNTKLVASVGGSNGSVSSNPDAIDTLILSWSNAACGSGGGISPMKYSVQTGASGSYLLRNCCEELVEDVVNMQVTYGVDTDGRGTPNYYAPAGSPGLDMEKVTSLRVSLLLETEDNLAAQPLAYTFNGETVAIPADRRIRRVFTSTFALRNRLR
jgi:type IV pilus assembly protein PilW